MGYYSALSRKELQECSVKFALRAKKPNAVWMTFNLNGMLPTVTCSCRGTLDYLFRNYKR